MNQDSYIDHQKAWPSTPLDLGFADLAGDGYGLLYCEGV